MTGNKSKVECIGMTNVELAQLLTGGKKYIISNFLGELSTKIEEDGEKDKLGGRPKLAGDLLSAVELLNQVYDILIALQFEEKKKLQNKI